MTPEKDKDLTPEMTPEIPRESTIRIQGKAPGSKADKKFASSEKVGCLRQPYSYECRFFCHQSNNGFVSQKLKDCFVRLLNRRTALLTTEMLSSFWIS